MFESTNNSSSSQGANLSLSLSGFVNCAVVSARSESLHESGSLHDSSPGASSGGEGTSLDDLALLKTSSEVSNDSLASDSTSTSAHGASLEGSSASSEDSADHASLSLESSKLLGLSWDRPSGSRFATSATHISSLVGLADHWAVFESLDKFAKITSFSATQHGAG